MISRTPTLAEWPYRMVRLACDLCPRRGQYRKETLVALYGGDMKMPDLRRKIAHCPRFDAPGAACTTRICVSGATNVSRYRRQMLASDILLPDSKEEW
jgi:hypothetical protein